MLLRRDCRQCRHGQFVEKKRCGARIGVEVPSNAGMPMSLNTQKTDSPVRSATQRAWKRAKRLPILPVVFVSLLAGCTPAQEWAYENHDSQGTQYSLSGASGHFASVDAFRHSIGVVVHNAYGSSSYGNPGAIVARLLEAGITHVAGSMYANPDPSWSWFNQYNYNYINQFQQAGITWAFSIGAPNDTSTGTPAQVMAAVNTKIQPGMVDGFIWPNEYDISGDAAWATNEAAFGAAEYAAVKADPMVSDRPVIGPSLVNDNSPPILGNQSASMDTGGIHPYTQCQSPTPAYDQAQMARAGVTAPGKPVWATEAGNSTALNETSGMRPCSEAVQAVYAVRTYLQHFTDGIGRTYMYELMEESPDPGLTNSEDHFGLLRSDYSEKPAFVAIKNLLSIVGYGAPITTTPLSLSLTGDSAGDLQQLVLQKANGSYVVALWRTASIWNHDTLTNVDVAPEQISVGLPTATSVTAADPITGTAATAVTLSQGHATVAVGADPVILSVTTS
jgi:hypothetical protein